MRKLVGFLSILAITSAGFMGCGKTKTITGPTIHDTDTVYIKMATVGLKTVLGGTGSTKSALPKAGVLAKVASIDLNKLVVTLTSSTQDTVRDTLTTSTTPAISATSTSPQTLNKNYNLKPLRTWKLVAKTLDVNNIVIHMDSVTTGQLNPADTVNVNLSMTAKYQMYEVKFLTLPDSIHSTILGTGKDILNVRRLKFVIDSGTVNEIVVDSVNTFFAHTTTHTLSHDYVTPGSHRVQMYVFGPMNSWVEANPLYYADVTINVAVGVDHTEPVTMSWVGPTTGTGKLSVTIGKVGKITVNGTLPGGVIN